MYSKSHEIIIIRVITLRNDGNTNHRKIHFERNQETKNLMLSTYRF